MEKQQASLELRMFFYRIFKIKSDLKTLYLDFDKLNRESIYINLESICEEFETYLKEDKSL